MALEQTTTLTSTYHSIDHNDNEPLLDLSTPQCKDSYIQQQAKLSQAWPNPRGRIVLVFTTITSDEHQLDETLDRSCAPRSTSFDGAVTDGVWLFRIAPVYNNLLAQDITFTEYTSRAKDVVTCPERWICHECHNIQSIHTPACTGVKQSGNICGHRKCELCTAE